MIYRLRLIRASGISGVLLGLLIGTGLCNLSSTKAEEPAGDGTAADRLASLKEMRTAAAAIKITDVAAQQSQLAKLVDDPIFRYTDEPRQIRDATMWVWTVEGRPVSVMKLERYGFDDPARRWLYNIGSVSPNIVDVKWPFDRTFRSKQPGLTFQLLPNAVAPVENKGARLTQIKQIARRFSVTMQSNATDKTEMRMLTTPLFHYVGESSQFLDGVLFGFSATGTNPDAIVAIQLRGSDFKSATWEYAATGTTTAGLQVRLDDKLVWSQPNLVGRGQIFETWTWFFSERIE